MPDVRGAIALTTNYALDKAKHGSPELHKFGQSLLDPTFVSTLNGSQAAAVGVSEEVARADHVHGLNLGHTGYQALATTEPFVVTTTRTAVPGASISIPDPGVASRAMCTMVCDWDAVAIGFGLGLAYFQVSTNGGAFTTLQPINVWAPAAVSRMTIFQQASFAINAGDSTVVRISVDKTGAGGDCRLHATHTNLQVIVLKG